MWHDLVAERDAVFRRYPILGAFEALMTTDENARQLTCDFQRIAYVMAASMPDSPHVDGGLQHLLDAYKAFCQSLRDEEWTDGH